MKVIEGMKPSEVLKAVEDGETKLAWFNSVTEKWVEWEGVTPTVEDVAQAIGCKYKVGVIDDSKPAIDWDGFDWEFFRQYGGLRVNGEHRAQLFRIAYTDIFPDEHVTVVESPFYPWFGGKQPVPDNMEVQIEKVTANYSRSGAATSINRKREVLLAKDVVWDWRNVIAFRLTGKVL